MARAPDSAPSRWRPGPRHAGEASAGQVLAVMAVGLVLAALVNADALVERAESKPFGRARDRALAIWHPVQDLGRISQLTRLRDLGDWVVGNEDRGAASVAPSTPPIDAPGAARPVLRAPAAGAPLRVYLGGDSIMHDAGNAFLDLAAGSPIFTSTLHYENATGLARPDFYDWPAALAADLAEQQPEVVFLLFGGNDGQGIVTADGTAVQSLSDPAWQEEYRRRVERVMDVVRADGRLVFWIGLPPMRSSDFDAKARIMSGIYREAAETRPWVTYVDTVPLFGDADGGFAARLTDSSGRAVDVRKDDGIHFNTAGAERLARHLLDLLDREIQATRRSG
jgi:uncharacterized protein